MKKCTKCNEEKQLTEEYFHKDKKRIIRFRSWCKICHSQDMRDRYNRNKIWTVNSNLEVVLVGSLPHLECKKCRVLKSLNKENFKSRKAGTIGFLGTCRDCLSKEDSSYYKKEKEEFPECLSERRKRTDHKRYHTETRKEYRRLHQRSQYLMTTYGISLEQYEELKANQGNKCAICGGKGKGIQEVLDVDHDHKTGKVRGLLCSKCNSGLGMLQDNPHILKSALQYLEVNKEKKDD